MSAYRPTVLSSAVQPIVEAMEERRLLSASIEAGILTVEGTDQNDVITVNVNRGRALVNVNGERQVLPAKGLKQVVVNAGEGDDQVRLGSKVRIQAKLLGDAGNDLLMGGGAADMLLGEAGLDTLIGGGGNDQIKGGLNDDQLRGGAGNDHLDGEGGNDDLFGDAGADDLDGGAGNDGLDGGRGRDRVKGGKGKDAFSMRDAAKERRDQNRKLDASEVVVTLDQVPEEVKAAFEAKYSEMTIRKVEMETEEDDTFFIYDFTNEEGLRYKAKYTDEGEFNREWAIGRHKGPAIPPVVPEIPQMPELPVNPDAPEDLLPEVPETPEVPELPDASTEV